MTCHFRVNQNSSAVFTHDNFLVHLNFHLALSRNAIEATAACIALHINNAQSVTGIFAYALECCQQTSVNLRLKLLGLVAKLLFILLGFRNNFFKFALLFCKDVLFILQSALCLFDLCSDFFNLCTKLTNFLFSQLNVQLLVFNFLLQIIIFAIVSNTVNLLGITFNEA